MTVYSDRLEEAKRVIFAYVAERTCEAWTDDDRTVTFSQILKAYPMPKYRIRKALRQLRDEGLLKYAHVKIYDGYDLYPPINGYLITQKARETDAFKSIEEKVREKWQELCGFVEKEEEE